MSLQDFALTFPPCESIQSALVPAAGAGLPDGTTHKIAFRPYGDYKTAKKIIFTVHGLVGNSLDFHYLSEFFLTKGYAIINVELMGRAESQGSDSNGNTIGTEAYCYEQYLQDIFNALVHVRTSNTNPDSDLKWFWIGISMGSLMGMLMVELYAKLEQEHGIKFNALFFNDLSPLIPWNEIEMVVKYLIVDHPVSTREEAAAYFELLYKPHYGPKVDSRFFSHRALYNLTYRQDTKTYHINYDYEGVKAIVDDTSRGSYVDIEGVGKCFSCMDSFSKLTVPLLVYRGELSTILPQVLLDRMELDYKNKGADFKAVVWPETGHTPPLYQIEEFEPILEWFEKY